MRSGRLTEDKINTHDPPDKDKAVGAGLSRGVERRAKARVRTTFPATVRGINTDGKAFESETHLNNLSAGGLHLSLNQPVAPGSNLFVLIWLAPTPNTEIATPRVAVQGRATRVEKVPGDAYGIAMTITHYRFL